MKLSKIWSHNNPRDQMLTRLQNDLDRLIQNFSQSSPQMDDSNFFSPTCELTEEKSNYIMKFDLPGVKKEDLKIEIDGNHLSVSAERREEKKSEDRRSRLSEISYGIYQRDFTLPAAVDDKKVDAKFDNGGLTLTMPKTEAAKSKQIAIH